MSSSKKTAEELAAYKHAWYMRNRKKALASAKAYAQTHRAETNTASRNWKRRNRKSIDEKRRRKRDELPELAMWENAKQRARKRGWEFTITPGDIIIPEVCPVLGIPISRRCGRKGGSDDSASLDRKDSRGGYTPGNIQVISWRANRIKKDATLEDLQKLVAFMEAQCENQSG